MLLDVDGYWAPIVRFFDAAVDPGFVRPSHRMLRPARVTVDEAIALATRPVPDTPHKWLDRDGTRDQAPRRTGHRKMSDTRRPRVSEQLRAHHRARGEGAHRSWVRGSGSGPCSSSTKTVWVVRTWGTSWSSPSTTSRRWWTSAACTSITMSKAPLVMAR